MEKDFISAILMLRELAAVVKVLQFDKRIARPAYSSVPSAPHDIDMFPAL